MRCLMSTFQESRSSSSSPCLAPDKVFEVIWPKYLLPPGMNVVSLLPQIPRVTIRHTHWSKADSSK